MGKDAVCDFYNSMTEGSKYCSDVIKKTFQQKTLRWLKKMTNILRTLLNIGFVITCMLMVIKKWFSYHQKIKEAQHINIVISRLH